MSAPLLPVRPLYPLARQAFAPGKLCCCFEDPPSALLMWCVTLFLLQATLHSSFAFLTPPTTYLPHPPSFSPCIMNLGGAYLFGVTMQHAQGKPEFQAEPAAVWWGTLKGALICSACASGMAAGVNEGIAAAVVASSHSGFGFLWGLASVPIMLVGVGVTMTWSAVSAVYARRKIRARLGLPNSDLADALTGCCCHSCQMTQDFRTAVALANESGSATAWTPILSQTTTTTTTTTTKMMLDSTRVSWPRRSRSNSGRRSRLHRSQRVHHRPHPRHSQPPITEGSTSICPLPHQNQTRITGRRE